jgi:hypothetical protein
MYSTTTTKTPAQTRAELERGRQKWQAVVDQLYRKLDITPGNTATLEILSHKRLGLFEETMIRQIHQGELQIQNFNKLIEQIPAPEQVPERQTLP